jgi:hypothetical protein
MQKQFKTRTQVCTSLDKDIYRRLQEYSNKTMIPISRIIDKSITMFLEKADK